MQTRQLTTSEFEKIESVLRELREHFHEFKDMFHDEHGQINFAIYEGCESSEHCRGVLESSAPFAIGKRLVSEHGFEWDMIEVQDDWHYGVSQSALNDPVDLMTLSSGTWYREETEELPGAVSVIIGSLDALAEAAQSQN